MKDEKLIIDLIKDMNFKLDRIAGAIGNIDKKLNKISSNLFSIKLD